MTEQTTEQRLRARQPERCPACDSSDIAPLFDGDKWDCADCAHVWEAKP